MLTKNLLFHILEMLYFCRRKFLQIQNKSYYFLSFLFTNSITNQPTIYSKEVFVMADNFWVGIFDFIIYAGTNNNHKTEFSGFSHLPLHEEYDDIDFYDDLCDYDDSDDYVYGF